jgi:hypothetical protein
MSELLSRYGASHCRTFLPGGTPAAPVRVGCQICAVPTLMPNGSRSPPGTEIAVKMLTFGELPRTSPGSGQSGLSPLSLVEPVGQDG